MLDQNPVAPVRESVSLEDFPVTLDDVYRAHALIRANKRFDYFVFPGQRHGYGDMSDYWFWLRAEYFVKHLLGDERVEADIAELRMMGERN